MITSDAPRQTAKIFVFPLRERTMSRATTAQKLAAMEAASKRVADAALGSAWYHEAAIVDEKRDDC